MISTCAGGPAPRLVDARFLRPLEDRERTELETHLSSCAWCGERYRKLQLAERIASVGMERAVEEPSALEIERIAQDLHLVESTVSQPSWLRILQSKLAGYSALVAVAAAVVLFLVLRPPQEILLERGGSTPGVTFSAFVINADGSIRPHDPAMPVKAGDNIKLRASWTKDQPAFVYAAIYLSDGTVQLAKLEAPQGPSTGATIPGAITLSKLFAGAELRVIGSEVELDDEAAKTLAKQEGQLFRLEVARD